MWCLAQRRQLRQSRTDLLQARGFLLDWARIDTELSAAPSSQHIERAPPTRRRRSRSPTSLSRSRLTLSVKEVCPTIGADGNQRVYLDRAVRVGQLAIDQPNPSLETEKPPPEQRLSLERVTGIEPAWPAWKAGTLPLSYTRKGCFRLLDQPKPVNVQRARSSMVGATGFEPAAPCSQSRCATKLRYAP
jgi:hypothetical protein